jgi:copper(I)-binding protein
VQGLKANAAAGDTIAITFKITEQGETVLVINITNHAEMIQPEWEVAL